MNVSNKNGIVAAGCLILVVIAVAFWWGNRGYGTVSPYAYKIATALYGACLAESEARLDRVEKLLDVTDDAAGKLTDSERKYFATMIGKAKRGKWKAAAESARRMMEDQVEY